ncbi:hypothetical protein FRB95_014883 [Tulasnella sp. JGI-2019a]|nr:hypothetical protein FRB95_014883 [Tulasnella sp. JGI-2019a]
MHMLTLPLLATPTAVGTYVMALQLSQTTNSSLSGVLITPYGGNQSATWAFTSATNFAPSLAVVYILSGMNALIPPNFRGHQPSLAPQSNTLQPQLSLYMSGLPPTANPVAAQLAAQHQAALQAVQQVAQLSTQQTINQVLATQVAVVSGASGSLQSIPSANKPTTSSGGAGGSGNQGTAQSGSAAKQSSVTVGCFVVHNLQ